MSARGRIFAYALTVVVLIALTRLTVSGPDTLTLLSLAAVILIASWWALNIHRATQAALAANKFERQVLGRICPQCGYDFRANCARCSECGWENARTPAELK